MGVLTSLRRFNRHTDGITIFLRLDEWPADVPLPPQTDVLRVGENHELPLYPQWRFVLEPEWTVEVLTGLFVIPLSPEDTLSWYETELKKLGWVIDSEKRFVEPTWASLRFEHPETQVHVSLSLRYSQARNDTAVTIWRVLKHPFTPPAETAAETVDAPLEEAASQ